tara:strand:+ start:828 stop:1892 length:1065 start_codon:yes stop_codon:yes gene_type:complete
MIDTRHQVTKMTSLILFVVVLFATCFVPLVVSQSLYFTYIGLFNSALFGSIYWVVSRGKPANWHKLFVTIGCFITLIPLVIISGGVNSQFIVLFPMIPIPLALMSNSRFSWWVSSFMLVLIFTLLIFKDYLPDLTNEVVSLHKSRSRAIWVSLAIIISATFVMYFDRANRLLRHKLSKQAFEDELTQIANRRSIMQLLQEKCHENNKHWLSVLMIDVDHFKQFNDQYGHPTGDECLRSVAHSIKHSIRSNIDTVGRYGGEEFLVILDDVSEVQATNIAEKIRSNIAKLRIPVAVDATSNVSVTIGVFSTIRPYTDGVEKLLQSADEALYQGKKQGRNTVVYYTAQDKTLKSAST